MLDCFIQPFKHKIEVYSNDKQEIYTYSKGCDIISNNKFIILKLANSDEQIYEFDSFY